MVPRPRTRRTYIISPTSVAHLLFTAFSSPFTASAMGWVLQQAAMWLAPGNWLESALGVAAFRNGGTVTATPTATYHGVRSLHWRNTVGLGVWSVAGDAMSLFYRYLRLKRRAKVTVEDRPFVGAIVESLELKGNDEEP